MKRRIVLPNLMTALSLCCGLFVIFKVNMMYPREAFFEQVQFCTKILLVAAFVDVLDGALARAIQGESEFGGFFDSMADSVSFGIAPAILVLKTLSIIPGTVLSMLVTGAAMLFSTAGVLRLVRYSTTPQSTDPSDKGYFTGLPITISSIAVVSPTLILAPSQLEEIHSYQETFRCGVAIFVFCFLAYLMVSRWKFISIKSINFKISNPIFFAPIVLGSSVILFLAWHHFAFLLFAASWGYIAAAWMIAIRKSRNEKSVEDGDEEE